MYVFLLYIANIVASSKPTLKQLQNLRIITSVAVRWYQLGIELLDNSQVDELNNIKANNQNDVEKGCLDMFECWLKTHSTASWKKLVDALRKPGVDMNTVAATLESNFLA